MTDVPSPPENLPASDPENALRHDVIAFWVQVAVQLGFPRSVGEIYGSIFLSETPLNADDLVARLQLSRSAAGQGLKTLLEAGAIRSSHQMNNRKEHFQLETDLGVLVKALLNSRFLPRLEQLSQNRQALHQTARDQANPLLIQRFDKLDRWGEKIAPLLAILKSLA